MAFLGTKTMCDAEVNGQGFFATWRKTPSQTTAAGTWFDLSMSPGNPVPNYYIGSPNTFTRLAQSTDYGIPHGGNVAQKGYTKYLKMFTTLNVTAAAAPIQMMLCDYVGFYPFLDESTGSQQFLDNTAKPNRWLPSATATLGPELAAQTTTTTGWTAIANCAVATDGANLTMTASAANAYAGQYITVVPGKMYRVEFTVLSAQSASGSPIVQAGSVTGSAKNDYGIVINYGNAGNVMQNFYGITRSFLFTAASATLNLQFFLGASAVNADNVVISYVSVKSVTEAVLTQPNPGLQMLPVVVAAHVSPPSYFVNYTNQDGVPNRWTSLIAGSAQTVNGTILVNTTASGSPASPFLNLQFGDTGVRSVDSILFTTIDVGLISLALVMPIENTQLRGIDAPVERVCFQDFVDLPNIPDDAFLALICMPNGSLSAAPFHGTIQTIWG